MPDRFIGCRPDRLSGQILANYLGQGWSAAMAIAFLPAYVAILGPASYGLVALFALALSVLAIVDVVVASTLLRESARYKSGQCSSETFLSVVESIKTLTILLAAGLLVIVLAGSSWAASHWIQAGNLTSTSVSQALNWTAVVLAIRVLEGAYRGILTGLERQWQVNLWLALTATARYPGALAALLLWDATTDVFFAWQATVAGLSVLILARMARRAMPPGQGARLLSLAALRSVAGFSVPMVGLSVATIALTSVDKLLLTGLVDLAEFGRYALASMATGLLYVIVVPLTQGAAPRMVGACASGNVEPLADIHRRVVQLTTLLVGTAGTCLALFPGHLIYAWSGDQALVATVSPYLSCLAIAAMANCFGHLGYNLLLTAGRVPPLLRIAVLALATAAVVLPPMVTRWGGIGAAYACIGINVAQAFVTLGLAHGKILPGLGFSLLRRDVMIPAMVIGLVMVAAWRLQPGIAEGRGTALVFLLTTAAISLVLSAFFAPAIRWEFGMRYIRGPRR